MRACLECATKFKPVRIEQRYCGLRCRKAFHRRREQRGAEMYDLVMAWRHDRKNTGPDALAYLCGMATTFKEEDKRAGRGRSYLTVAELKDQLIQFGYGNIFRKPREAA